MATLEVLISLAILFSASLVVLGIMQRQALAMPSQYPVAIFSIVTMLYGNESIASCAYSGRYTEFCNETIKMLMGIYGLKHVSLHYGSSSLSIGSSSSCRFSKTYCILYYKGTMCINVCGG